MRKLLILLSFVIATGANAQSPQLALPDFTALVERNAAAVVNVQAESSPKNEQLSQQEMEELHQGVPDIFRRIFEMPNGEMPQRRGGTSVGSGFIISSDGYVLTNNHVVDGATKVTIRLSDRREFDGRVVGRDADTDVALLKVEARDLPVVKLGSSEALKIGEWVVAIGSPFNFDHSVTAGIVSAKGRSFGAEQRYVPFIQTDVPINRGNSGGPLFNLKGEVVGINSQIFSNTGNYIGLSFAIPIEVAQDVAGQLKDSGTVTRGLLGVGIEEVTRALSQTLGMKRVAGALVTRVEPGGAADKAGIRVRDVITAFNGKPVIMSADLPPLVGRVKPGTSAQVTIFRGGKEQTLSATVTAVPKTAQNAAPTTPLKQPEIASPLGLQIVDLTPQQRQQAGVSGVLVQRVTGDAARSAGIQPGDVITMLGGETVSSVSEFNARAKALGNQKIIDLLVTRGGASSFLVLER
jgi:serine protease Do